MLVHHNFKKEIFDFKERVITTIDSLLKNFKVTSINDIDHFDFAFVFGGYSETINSIYYGGLGEILININNVGLWELKSLDLDQLIDLYEYLYKRLTKED